MALGFAFTSPVDLGVRGSGAECHAILLLQGEKTTVCNRIWAGTIGSSLLAVHCLTVDMGNPLLAIHYGQILWEITMEKRKLRGTRYGARSRRRSYFDFLVF